MGSEAPTVLLNVTGFKPFHGVASNPTEILVSKLQEYVAQNGLPPCVFLQSCNVLETAASGALNELLALLDSRGGSRLKLAEAETRKLLPEVVDLVPDDTRTVWVHLGVNSGAYRFALENRAANEATFRCPDQLGWQPQKEAIVPQDGPVTYSRTTTLSTTCIAEACRKKGYDVAVSEDAGRFVCNYVYYHSLRHAAEHNAQAIFVHVPSFTVLDEDVQLAFIWDLLVLISTMC